MADFEEQTASKKLAGFIEKRKVAFIATLIVFICLLIGYVIFASVANNNKLKGLQAIDEITFEMTDKSSGLEEAEISARLNTAFEKVSAYTKKGGIVGARANMLCADITYQQKKYAESADFWKVAAEKAKKTYIAPLCYFNLAACYEETGNNEDAATYYKLAADDNSFVMRTHAMFSYGRLLEAKGDYATAAAAYTELNDNFSGDSWAQLAKSRLIALKNDGKIE